MTDSEHIDPEGRFTVSIRPLTAEEKEEVEIEGKEIPGSEGYFDPLKLLGLAKRNGERIWP